MVRDNAWQGDVILFRSVCSAPDFRVRLLSSTPFRGNRLKTAKSLFGLCLGLCMSTCLAAGIAVPSGASMDLAGGQLAAAGGDAAIGGTLQLGSGALVGLRNFTLSGGGQTSLGSGLVELFGDWSNAGNLDAGSSQVRFVDGGLASSGILGSSTFSSLSFVSSTGKRYLFQSGATQTVTNALTIQGTASAPIQFDVTSPGSVANINLSSSGSQAIQHVGVSDVHATGQHLAPSQSNEGGSGNAVGWFKALLAASIPVPGLTPWAMLMLLLAMCLLAWRRIGAQGMSLPDSSH